MAITAYVVRWRRERTSTLIDAAWICLSPAPSHAAQKLVARYLRRVRGHRATGFWVGLSVSLLSGLSNGSVGAGIGAGDTAPIADVIFGTMTGVLTGSLIAETWRLKPTSSRRSANIGPHAKIDHQARWTTAGLAIVAVSVAFASANQQVWTISLAAASALLFALDIFVQRSIRQRSHPGLPPDLLEADTKIRSYGSRRLNIEMLAGVLLFFSWQVSFWDSAPSKTLMVAVVLGSFIASLVLMSFARPWPPSNLRETRASVGSGAAELTLK